MLSRNSPFSRDNRSDLVKVLEYMYENEITISVEKRGWMSLQDFEAAIDSAQIYSNVETEGEIDDALHRLEEIGLVEGDDFEVSTYNLTLEGFQFTHRLKTERQRRTTNHILVFLTVVLVILTVVLVGVEIF